MCIRPVFPIDGDSKLAYSASVGIRVRAAPYVTISVTFVCSRFVPAGARCDNYITPSSHFNKL
jgi:hypothetical protein